MFALPGGFAGAPVTASIRPIEPELLLELLPCFAAPNAPVLPTAELPLLLVAQLVDPDEEDLPPDELPRPDEEEPVYLELPLAPNAIYKSHS